MSTQSRKGGILGILLGGVLITVLAVAIITIFVVNTVKVEHRSRNSGDSLQIQTPLGDVNIDARDNLNPDAVGVPIYPGAERTHKNHGGVMFSFDDLNGDHKKLAVATASYTTNDSAKSVQEFYHSHLPNWTISQRDGHDLTMRYSENGYKRVVSINERNSATQIGIASFGDPGVN